MAISNEALKNNVASSPVSNIYFSSKNMDVVHEAIRYRVYVKSKNQFVIDRQSDTELKIIMRSIFIQNCKNLPYDILGQVQELNSMVIRECSDKILNEIIMYKRYLVDIDRLPTPLPRSENVSSAGNKTLAMREFL